MLNQSRRLTFCQPPLVFQCDETLPHCKSCTTRGLPCSYGKTTRSHKQIAGTMPAPNPSLICSTTENSRQDSHKFANRALDALLWQYYLVHASTTMSSIDTDPSHVTMWEMSVPAVAFSNPVASHAIMALSAFCMSATTSNETGGFDFRATAQLHYYQALKQMQALLPVLDRDKADAVLTCGMVLIPCGLALTQGGIRNDTPNDWLHHLRGFKTLGEAIYDEEDWAVSASQLVPYPQKGIPNAEIHELSRDDDDIVGSAAPLFNRIRCSWQDAVERLEAAVNQGEVLQNAADSEACMSAIKSLSYVINYILTCRVQNLFRAVFAWPTYLSPHYIRLVTSRVDLAIAIYSHWLVLTMLLEDMWWVADFGSERIRCMSMVLERSASPYRPLLEWPVNMRAAWRSFKD